MLVGTRTTAWYDHPYSPMELALARESLLEANAVQKGYDDVCVEANRIRWVEAMQLWLRMVAVTDKDAARKSVLRLRASGFLPPASPTKALL